MLNKVILMGRLVRDPELRNTPSGLSVASFTLAVDRAYAAQGEERQTDFINIIAWRSTADFVAKYFTKGQLMALTGKLQVRSWDDAKTGQKRYATDVVADEVFFAGKKENGTNSAAVSESPVQGFTEADMNDTDLPF